jgi:two-component system phosphate regulon response regulator PhoB/two-component system alkaline phosphatase synthesis response regulator PhoP
MARERILVVEDEESLVDILTQALKRQGYEVYSALDGDTALDIVSLLKPDVVILDIMLPEMDGWEVCRRLKNSPETAEIPIIMLTARREEKDVVEGLNIGADDYVKKPFSLPELLARIKVIIKRTSPANTSAEILNGALKLYGEEGSVYLREKVIDLSPTEFQILEALVIRDGRVVTREELLARIWGLYGGDTRTVDVHVSRLRHKLDDGKFPRPVIQSLRGRGYRFSWEE